MVVPVSLQQGESASECYCLAVKEGVSKLKVGTLEVLPSSGDGKFVVNSREFKISETVEAIFN